VTDLAGWILLLAFVGTFGIGGALGYALRSSLSRRRRHLKGHLIGPGFNLSPPSHSDRMEAATLVPKIEEGTTSAISGQKD
jgi:hypothetical protein